MKKLLFILLLAINLLAKTDESVLEIVSPKDGVEVDYNFITFKVKTTGIFKVTAKNLSVPDHPNYRFFNYEMAGVEYKDDVIIHNVPLIKGENSIQVTAYLKDNLPTDNKKALSNHTIETKTITIHSKSTGYFKLPLGVSIVKKEQVNKKMDVTLKAVTNISNIKSYYYDFEGDGKIDKSSNENTISYKYTEGSNRPLIMIETKDNLLFSSHYLATRPISIEENNIAESEVDYFYGKEIIDMQFWGYLYILTNDKVYIVNIKDDSIKQIINLGDVSNPQGFWAETGSPGEELGTVVYVADTGNNRIVRYTERDNFQRDENYTISYNFNQAVDVVAGNEKGEDKQITEVLDRGNNQVIGFYDGKLWYTYTAEGTHNGKLSNPINFINHYVVDRDGQMVRWLHIGNKQTIENLPMNYSGEYGKIADRFTFCRTDTKELILRHSDGSLQKKVPLNNTPKIATSANFSENDKVYIAYKDKPGLFYVKPFGKPVGERPFDVAKKFAIAIKTKDTYGLLKLSLYNSKLVNSLDVEFLGKVLAKTVEYEEGFNDGSYATISAITDYEVDFESGKAKGRVRFLLSKADGQFYRSREWFIERVTLYPIKDEK